MKITVHVTQDDIDKGCRYASSACPVFLAMTRAGVLVTGVCSAGWNMVGSFELYKFGNGHPCRTWINAYDREESVQPFSFEVEVPELSTTPTVAVPADSGPAEPIASVADTDLTRSQNPSQEEAPTFIQSHLDYLELRGEGILENAEAPVCDGSKSLEEAGITRNGGSA